jgi:hypothetical protein
MLDGSADSRTLAGQRTALDALYPFSGTRPPSKSPLRPPESEELAVQSSKYGTPQIGAALMVSLLIRISFFFFFSRVTE